MKKEMKRVIAAAASIILAICETYAPHVSTTGFVAKTIPAVPVSEFIGEATTSF